VVKLPREIGLFLLGGPGGLAIDAGIVQMLVGFGRWNPYLARVLSFLPQPLLPGDGIVAAHSRRATAAAILVPNGCTGWR